MAAEPLQIVITAVDRASSTLKAVSSSVRSFGSEIGQIASGPLRLLGSITGGVGSAVSGVTSAVLSLAKGAVSGFASVANAASYVVAPVERGVGALFSFASGVAEVAINAAKLATVAAVVGAPLKALADFAEFQQGIINAVAVTGLLGTAADEARARLMDLGRAMSQTSLFSAKETAGAFYELASAGVAIRDMSMATVRPILDLAQATGGNLQDATHLAIATLNQFRDQFKDGLTGANMTQIADSFTATINLTFATLDKLGDSMQFIGPVAAAMGQSLQTTLAQLGNLYNAGFEASIAGTSLRNALDEIAAPSGEAQDALAKLGVTTVVMTPQLLALKETVDAARTSLTANTDLVEALSDQMRGLSISVRDSERTLDKQKERFDRQKDSIDKTKQSIAGLRDQLDKLTRTKLPGMEGYDNQLFALEQQRKALELQKSQLAPFQLFESNSLTQQIAAIQKRVDQITLQRDIQFDPQTKAIEDAANAAKIAMGDVNRPMAAGDIVAQIGSITTQYQQQTASLDQLVARHDRRADRIAKEEHHLASLRDTLSDVRDRYNDAKDAQEGLKTALTNAEQAFADAPKKARVLVDVLDDLRAKGATAADFLAIFGKRGGPAMLALSGITDKVRDLEAQLNHVGGIAASTASEQLRGLTGAMHRVTAAFEATGLSIVERFEPQLVGIADRITGFVHEHGPQLQAFLEQASSWFGSMADRVLHSNETLWVDVRSITANGWQNVQAVWRIGTALVRGDTDTLKTEVAGIMARLKENVHGAVESIKLLLGQMIPKDWQDEWLVFRSRLNKMLTGEQSVSATVMEGLRFIAAKFREWWPMIEPYLHQVIEALKGFLIREWATIQPVAVDLGTKIGRAIIDGLKTSVTSGLSNAIDWHHVGMLDPRNADWSRQGFLDAYSGLKMMIRGYARGGVVPGVGTGDTVPAMLSPGEEILTPADPRHRDNGGMGIVLNFHGPISIRSDNDIKALARQISHELYQERRRAGAGMPA